MNTFLIIIVAIETVIIIAFIIYMLIKNKSDKIIVKTAENLGNGKLNIDDIDVGDAQNNYNSLAFSLNAIKANMLTFVETTKQNVVTLTDSVNTINESMKANLEGNEAIVNNSGDIDSKTLHQLDLVQQNMNIIEENSNKMEDMISFIDSILEALDETVVISKAGITNIEGYSTTLDVMGTDLQQIIDMVNKFLNEIKKVYDVGDFIVNITSQLKLLSFNASIEAARVGQAGRGFAVVADEMSSMSEQTRESMGRITEILKDVMESGEKVTESINLCTENFNDSKETFNLIRSSFKDIGNHSLDIQNKVSRISNTMNSLSSNSNISKDKATSLIEEAKLINGCSSNMSAISQEVAAEATNIGAKTLELNVMLESIQKMLKNFDTGVVPTKKKPTKTVKIGMICMYDNEFWQDLKKGAVYAKNELASSGAVIDIVPIMPSVNHKDVYNQICDSFKRFIENRFDGIIFPGFLHEYDSYLKDARNKGIILMAFNCDTTSPNFRQACLLPNAVTQGEYGAKATIKALNKNGTVAIIHGNHDISGNVDRCKGFKKVMSQVKGIRIIDEIDVIDEGKDVYEKTKQMLRKITPDIILLTNGFPLAVANAIVDSGLKGKTKVVGYDFTPSLFPFIKNGVIASVISQDAFGQGHDPITLMYNKIVANEPFPGELISCRLSVVDQSNIDNLIEL